MSELQQRHQNEHQQDRRHAETYGEKEEIKESFGDSLGLVRDYLVGDSGKHAGSFSFACEKVIPWLG